MKQTTLGRMDIKNGYKSLRIINTENSKILLGNEMLEEVRIQGKGLVTPSPQEKGVVVAGSFSLKEKMQLEESSESASIPMCIVSALRILKIKVRKKKRKKIRRKKTKVSFGNDECVLLKAALNVLEFNQNYLFLVSFAVVSFTLVHW